MEPNPYESPNVAGRAPQKNKKAEPTTLAKIRLVLIILALGIAWLYAIKLVGWAVATWMLNREFDRMEELHKK
jgi:hypothetical protein